MTTIISDESLQLLTQDRTDQSHNVRKMELTMYIYCSCLIALSLLFLIYDINIANNHEYPQ